MTTGESFGQGASNAEGTPVQGASRFDAHDAATLSLVTILFADVVSSTSQISGMELEDAQALLDHAVARMRQRIHQFGGTLARVQGDGIMAIFGAPTPMEDHALRACCAAHAMCEDFRALSSDTKPEPEFQAIRVGIHSGRALIRILTSGRGVDYDAVGPDVHFAAKVEERAPRNGALMTSETLALAGPSVVAAALGELSVGPARMLSLFELKALSFDPDIDRLLDQDATVRFVGRERSLRYLIDKVGATNAKTGSAVAIVGEAGIGKSRLVHEVARNVRRAGVRVEEILGISVLRRTPFASLRPFVAGLLDCKVQAALDEIGAAANALGVAAELQPGLFELLGAAYNDPAWGSMAGPDRRRIMFDAAADVIERALLHQPTLILVEDLHHLDLETTDFLAVLHRLVRERPLWLLVTARQAARDDAVQVSDEVIDLMPLSGPEAKELCRLLRPGGAPIADRDIERAVERAGGNPFFLQELVHTPVAMTNAAGSTDEQTPFSVASLVQSRMAALSPRARRVLQAASILGGEIDRRILALTAQEVETELEQTLSELEGQNLIDVTSANVIRFRHDLFRGGARMTLLRTEAAEIHRRAAQAFETLSGTSDVLERLAHHAERSGQIGKALLQLLNACKLGVRSSSQRTIRSLYDWAMRLKSSGDAESREVLLDLVMSSLDALQQSGDAAEYDKALKFAIELSQALNQRMKEGLARSHYAVFNWMRAHHAEARTQADTALQIAKETGVFALREIAQSMVATVQHATGELDQAIATFNELLAVGAREDERSPMGRMFLPNVRSRAFLAHFLSDRGRFAEARRHLDRAEAILGAIDQPYSRALLTNAQGRVAFRQDKATEAVRYLEQARDICLKHQLYAIEAGASGLLASALVQAGEPERGRAVARYSIFNKLYLHAGRYGWVYVFQGLAEAEFACGDYDRALETVAQAVAIASENQEPIHIAQTRTARGMMLSDGQTERGEEDLVVALALSEKHGLDPLAGDCHAGLAKLARRASDSQALRQHAMRGEAIFRSLGLDRRAAELVALQL